MGENFQIKVLNEYTWDKNADMILEAVKNMKEDLHAYKQ